MMRAPTINERRTNRTNSATGRSKKSRLFEHPYYWAAFILIADPN